MEKNRSNRQRPPPPDCSNPTPWLVFPHEFKSKSKPNAPDKHTFCSTTTNKFYLKSIPELHGKSAIGCYHGWLLLVDRHIKTHNNNINPSLSLWNPVSFQTLSLPPLPTELHYNNITATILKRDGNDSEAWFVLVFSEKLAAFCRPGDPSWVTQIPQIEAEGEIDPLEFADVTLCGGKLYGWAYAYGLEDSTVLIDIHSDGSSYAKLRFRGMGRLEIHKYYNFSNWRMEAMAECCGELYLFYIYLDPVTGKRVAGAEAWRLDEQKRAWIRLNSLKGHVFYKCSHYCISCHSDPDSDSDSGGLYFVLPGESTLYHYKVEDASLTAMLPWPNLTTPWLDPFWVLPSHPRPLVPGEREEHSSEKNGNKNNLDNRTDIPAYKSSDMPKAENETIFSKLPQNLITVITENLPLFDYLDLRCTCKELQVAVAPIQYRTTPSLLKMRNSPPLLMLLRNHATRDYMEENANGDPFLWDVIEPTRLDAKYPMSIPKSFEGATVTFSSRGWLLARKKKDSLYFLNPFTRVSGEYPQHDHLDYISGIGFSSYPTSPDCVTVGMDNIGINEVYIRYFRHGDGRWTLCSFDLHENGFRFSQACNWPAFHDGAFYFLDKKGYLGKFELRGEEASWRVFDERAPIRSVSVHLSRVLVDCDGGILVVAVGFMGKWVDVFKWNPLVEGWDKLESLGEQTIFISPYSSFSAKATRPGMGNRVYFPRFYGGSIVFYSLGTKKWHCVGSEEQLNGFYGTAEFLSCCYIEPSFSH